MAIKYKIKDIIKSQDYNKIPSKFLFKYFFIPLAWPITFLFVNLGVSPNQATLIRLVTHIIAYLFILLGNFLLGYILIYLAIILDCVDGQIARTTNRATFFGKFFDGWLDCLFEISFIFFVSLAISTKDENIINIALLAALMNALLWITLLRFSLNKNNGKIYKFRNIENKIFNFLDNRLLVDWFDIKYFIFPFFVFFNKEKEFIFLLLIVNSFLFLVYALQKIYIGYSVLNVHRSSSSSRKVDLIKNE